MNLDSEIVFVVDDDSSICKSFQRLIQIPGVHVKTFCSSRKFLESCIPDVPSCLILDVQMPDLNGLDLQKELADANISMPIIFITGHGTIPISVEAMKAGAQDFLEKPVDRNILLKAIEKALEKDRHNKLEKEKISQIQERYNFLTPRERDVCNLVITGMLNKQIAYELGISEKTVKIHRSRVMRKMQTDSVAELVTIMQKLNR